MNEKKKREAREIQGRKERELRGRQGGIEERADRKKMNERGSKEGDTGEGKRGRQR